MTLIFKKIRNCLFRLTISENILTSELILTNNGNNYNYNINNDSLVQFLKTISEILVLVSLLFLL